jgi:hypothetical protein
LSFAVTGLILTWLVLSRSFAAFLANTAPQAALWFDPGYPAALVNLAELALTTGGAARTITPTSEQTSQAQQESGLSHAFSRFEKVSGNFSVSRPLAPDNAALVRGRAERALVAEPLNARGLRILGQLAEADGDDDAATKFMRAAQTLSRHENYVSYWLVRHSALQHDYKSTVSYADVLLRTTPQSATYVMPLLAQISEDKDGAALLYLALASNPPWRKQFIAALPQYVTDARRPLDLLLELRSSSVPPASEDVAPYINLLIARKFYDLAYYTWLQFLSPEELRRAGLLFNGSFEAAPSGLPFDWKITPGAGVTIDIVPRPDNSGEHALLVDFQYGRVDYQSVTELVMLAPGTYEFKAAYKGNLVGRRGMKWRVICANGATTTGGESEAISGAKDWTPVAFTFTVPDKDCSAQYVRLDLDARMPSEQFVSGPMMFDDLQISHVASPPAAGG